MTVRIKKVKKGDLDPNRNVIMRRKDGGTLIASRPIFSSDSKYVFLNCGWGVKAFSVGTGEYVRTMDLEGDGRVKSLFNHRDEIGAVTSEGFLTFWRPKSSKVLRSFDLILPEKSSVADAIVTQSLEDKTENDICLILIKEKKEKSPKIILKFYNPKNGTVKSHPLDKKRITDKILTHSISYGGSDVNPVIATITSRGLNIFPLNGDEPIFDIAAGNVRRWTCVRCHPLNDSVAVGDDTGRVVLLKSTVSKGGPKPVYHWHTLPCNDISFTPAGSSMFTVGNENVLVKWNLENPQMRNYLPRLSANIVHVEVSPDNQFVAVSTLDNGIHIVTATNKIHCVLQELSWAILPSNWLKPFPAGLTYEPRTHSILLNGKPGHLQLYSPQTGNLNQIIDVTMQNQLTQERNKFIVNTEVTKSALSDDGAWLATVECRVDEGVENEIRLKFWQYLSAKKCFSLNTSIELPHDKSLDDLSFRPGSGLQVQNDSDDLDYLAVTTGGDKKARIWSPSPLDSVYRKGILWECQNTCFYRDMECGPSSFSYDSSLLAIAFQTSLTLWDVDNISLKESLSRGTEHLKFVEFGRRDCCHLVFTATKSQISVWNLLTLSLHWCLDMSSSFIVADPFSNYTAVFSEDNKLVIFNLESEKAVYSKENLSSKAVAGVFIPRDKVDGNGAPWLTYSQLFYINADQELYGFEHTHEYEPQKQNLTLDNRDEALTPFAALIAKQQENATAKYEKVSHAAASRSFASTAAINQLLKSGAHTLPPVSLICSSLLRSLVTFKDSVEKDKTEKKAVQQKMDVDDPSSSDEEEPKPVKNTKKRKSRSRSPEKLISEPIDMNSLFPEAFMDDEEDETPKFIIDDGENETPFIIDEGEAHI